MRADRTTAASLRTYEDGGNLTSQSETTVPGGGGGASESDLHDPQQTVEIKSNFKRLSSLRKKEREKKRQKEKGCLLWTRKVINIDMALCPRNSWLKPKFP